jgi:hypothetical protein
MKSLLLATAGWLFLSSAPADDLKRDRLPADVDFVVHLDIEGFKQTELFRQAMAEGGEMHVDLEDLATRLRVHGEVRTSAHLLRLAIVDNGRPFTLSLFPDGRAIVHGTAEAGVARSLYAKYVGN